MIHQWFEMGHLQKRVLLIRPLCRVFERVRATCDVIRPLLLVEVDGLVEVSVRHVFVFSAMKDSVTGSTAFRCIFHPASTTLRPRL